MLQHQQDLQNIGLSEKETIIYLASLELGPATVQEISKKTGIVRTSVYNVAESLKEKGLIVETFKDRRRFLVSQSPDRLLSHVRVQKKELEEKEKEKGLQDILPELKGLVDLFRCRPKIRFFEGKEGIRLMREDILNTKNLACIEEFIPLDDTCQLFRPHKRDHRHHSLDSHSNRIRRPLCHDGLMWPSL